MTKQQLKCAVLGASGYTGAEMMRLIGLHPNLQCTAASAGNLAGKRIGEVFPHLGIGNDHILQTPSDIDWSTIDIVFSCLPHGTSQDVLLELPEHIKVVDLSADFRFRNVEIYEATYGRKHIAPEKSETATYGLTEFAREELKRSNLIACPGCYPTATLLSLLPPLAAGLIALDNIVIDAKSGVSGAGRGLKEANLFSEAAEGAHPYSVGNHRHAPEIEQELQQVCNKELTVSFTPHLIPMTRGELVTSYVELSSGVTVDDVHAAFVSRYEQEPFVFVKSLGDLPPDTRHTRGTNTCIISVHADRASNRAIIVSAIDNLIKGSSGQAIQNLNVAMGWPETLGLDMLTPLFP